MAVGGVLAAEEPPVVEPRDYAYLLLQGKVSGPNEDRPVEGVTVRLKSGSELFEAVTDQRGLFIFEKLPILSYRLQVTAPDGTVIHTMRQIDDPHRIRIRIKTHRGNIHGFRVGVEDGELAVDVPAMPVNWGKFWTQVGIVVGVLLLFTL
jgi:hypothetical protein